jgi:hypothetical protein
MGHLRYDYHMPFRKRENNLVSSAGWLYADLLLVLTIIGFGAIVARRDTDPPPAPKVSQLSSTNLNCNEFAIRLDSGLDQTSINQIVDDEVRSAISNGSLPLGDTSVGLVIIYGGYGSSETVTDGKTRAKNFIPKIKQTEWMNSSELVLGGANQVEIGLDRVSVGPREILLKVYLVYQGNPASSGC